MKFVREKKLSARKGRHVDVDWVFYSDEQQKAVRLPRAKRERASPPKQKKLNDHNSRKYFRMLVIENFDENDNILHISYKDPPKDRKEAARMLVNFLRRLKCLYKKYDTELKYAAVTEGGRPQKKDPNKLTRLHHHVIINGDVPLSEVRKLWRQKCDDGKFHPIGLVRADPLQPGLYDEGMSQIANYLTKGAEDAEMNERVWTCSRNLKRPMQTTNDNSISGRRMRQAVEAARNDELKEFVENIYRDYIMLSGYVGFCEVTGLAFVRFQLMRRKE